MPDRSARSARSLRVLAGVVVALATAAPAAAVPAVAQAATTDGSACTVSDGTLTWGFKESFRSYISGTIAKGSWATSEGATYTVPSFGWSAGTGSLDDQSAGTVAWTGAVRFTGHGGILDTTIANPSVVFASPSSAVLHLDVRGTTQEGEAIDERDVPFATLDLGAAAVDPAGGTVRIDAVTATLTAEGATAFGTYHEGTVLDPVTVTATTTCDAPTQTPSATTAPSPAVADGTPTAAASGSGGGGTSLQAGAIATGVGIAALLAAASTLLVVARRRRASADAPDPTTGGTP